mgnify:FL=1
MNPSIKHHNIILFFFCASKTEIKYRARARWPDVRPYCNVNSRAVQILSQVCQNCLSCLPNLQGPKSEVARHGTRWYPWCVMTAATCTALFRQPGYPRCELKHHQTKREATLVFFIALAMTFGWPSRFACACRFCRFSTSARYFLSKENGTFSTPRYHRACTLPIANYTGVLSASPLHPVLITRRTLQGRAGPTAKILIMSVYVHAPI